MKKQTVTIIVIAIVVIGGLIYWYSGKNSSNPGQTYQPAQPAAAPPSAPVQPSANSAPASNPASATITYTDSGFSPSTVTISKGGTVTWVNNASDDVRVASNPHPIHNGYPTTGGCVGSTFDSCSNIAPGSSWSFTFTFAGSWGYHNHLNPSEGGTVIVK